MDKKHTFRAVLQELRTDKSLRSTAIKVTIAYVAVFAAFYGIMFLYNVVR